MRVSTAALAATLLLAGCPPPPPALRAYPPPTAEQLLAHLRARDARIRTLRIDAKADYFQEKGDRVKVGIEALTEAPGHLRMEAQSPFGGSVATLVTDGKTFQLLDVRNNRFLEGEARPCNIARLLQVELRPEAVLAVLEGSAPLVDGGGGVGGVGGDVPDAASLRADVRWKPEEGGREVLALRDGAGMVETIELDGRDRRWDVLAAELRAPDGAVVFRLRHEDFGDVSGERFPARTTIEQPARKTDVRLRFRDREVNPTPPEGAFHLSPPAGVPVERVACE